MYTRFNMFQFLQWSTICSAHNDFLSQTMFDERDHSNEVSINIINDPNFAKHAPIKVGDVHSIIRHIGPSNGPDDPDAPLIDPDDKMIPMHLIGIG